MKSKSFIIFLLILLSSLFLLLLPESTSAFSVFGVGSRAMTTESIENYQNWPYEIRRQCVIEQSRVVTDCSKCGYENWVVYQTVEGQGKVDGKDCTMLYEGVVVGNYDCEFTEHVIKDGKLVGTELFITYEDFRHEENGATLCCRFSCHAWNCAEEEPRKKNKLEGLDRKHIRCQTYLYHDRDLDFKDDNTGETRHQMHDRFVREFGKELCEAEPGEDCTFKVVYERFVYLEKFAISQDDDGPYEAVYYEPEVLFGEFCIYCSCRDFSLPKTTLREGDLARAKRLLEKYEKYDLLPDIDQARVTPQFKSTGAASGHVADLTITSNADEPLTFGLRNTGLEGMLLVNPIEEEQNLVVATIPGISVSPTSYKMADSVTLNPNESITFPVMGYCANFDKKNPSEGIDLTLGDLLGVEPAEACILDSLLGDTPQTTVIDNLEGTEFPQSFTSEDVLTVKQIALWASQPENKDTTPEDYEARGYPIKEDYVPIIRDVLDQSGVNPDEIVALTGKKKEPEKPAIFITSDLTISPAEVDIGESVTIGVLVTNTGDLTGSYEVTLKIDNVPVATEDVTLAGGKSETVTFTIAEDTKGSYTVDIDGKVGQFTVIVPPPPTPTPAEALPVQPPTNWGLIGGIIAAIAALGLVSYFFIRKRRKAKV